MKKDGLFRIKKERQRQITHEGYSIERDREIYQNNELFLAACCYQAAKRARAIWGKDFVPVDSWPWDLKFWKPSPNDRIRELEKAGALFMAHNHCKGKAELIGEFVMLCANEIDEILNQKT